MPTNVCILSLYFITALISNRQHYGIVSSRWWKIISSLWLTAALNVLCVNQHSASLERIFSLKPLMMTSETAYCCTLNRFFFFFNHNYKKNWHQPFGGASLRVNSSPLFSVKSLTCLCTVAPLMKKCHVSIAFIRLYAASWGMCAGLHYKRRTQSLQGEEKQIQRTPLKSPCNLFLILTNMFNMFGCEADAVPLCRLPVSSKKELASAEW